jgi:hypothetical protein
MAFGPEALELVDEGAGYDVVNGELVAGVGAAAESRGLLEGRAGCQVEPSSG